MQRIFTAQKFFDGDVLHDSRRIVVEDEIVVAIERLNGTADEYLITPGFVDIQVNGFDSFDVSQSSSEELSLLDQQLRTLGTTHWLGTIVTAPFDRMNDSIQRVDKFCVSTPMTGCEGMHLEGPFLGEASGAHNKKWIVPFDAQFISQLPSTVKLMTVAPEQSDAAHFVSQLISQNIVVSAGHTKASAKQFNTVVAAGASMVTHVFNGMSGIHHRNGGIALQALTNKSIKTGLIADLVHVSPEIITLVFDVKGAHNVVLVSDSIAWSHERARIRGIDMRDGAPRLADDTLAGSCTPLAECVRNCVNVGIPLEDALIAATSAPADVMGFAHAGRVAIGQPVDLNVVSEDLLVMETLFRLPSIRG